MLNIISRKKLDLHRLNVADDALSVLNMFVDSQFIREVITTNPSKPPQHYIIHGPADDYV